MGNINPEWKLREWEGGCPAEEDDTNMNLDDDGDVICVSVY